MKSFLLSLFLLPCVAFTQNQNSIYPNLPYSNFNAIAVEGDNIFLSGSCNTGSISTDGGASYQNFELNENILSIKIVPQSNGNQAYYLTDEILYTLDATTLDFTAVTDASLSFMTGKFRSFEVVNGNVYLVATSSIYYAPVGSNTWEKLCEFTYTDNDYNNKSDATDNNIYIGSIDGKLSKVSLQDGSITELKDYEARIRGIAMATDNIGYVNVSGVSGADKTTDGWATTTNITTIEGIGIITYGEDIVISVNTNRLYVSKDQGLTATYIPTPDDGTVDLIYGSTVLEDGTIYLAGKSSMVLKTSDFGTTIENLNPYKRARLQAIEIGSDGIGYAVGSNGTVIQTKDNGLNWAPVDFGIADDVYISDIAILSNGRVLIGHGQGVSIIENDVVISNQTNSIDIFLYNTTDNYLIGLQYQGGEYVIIKSTNNGDSWETKGRIPDSGYFISQAPTGKIYIPSGDDLVYVSDDGGETWSTESYGIDNVSKIHFLNESVGLIVASGTLYKTTDGGSSITQISSGYLIDNIQFFDENNILFTLAQNSVTTIRESSDGGASFKTTGSYCTTTVSSYFDGVKTVWLGQSGGHINKHEVNLQPSSILDNGQVTLGMYPNPISKNETLNLNITGSYSGVLKLYNVQGQLVQTCNITNQSPEINLNEIKSGVYYVKVIIGSNDQIYSNKLIIVE